jgi:haloalkane dehalogenase
VVLSASSAHQGTALGVRLIAPDYAGFGYSPAPTGYGFTPQEHAGVVAALIVRLALKDLVLVV